MKKNAAAVALNKLRNRKLSAEKRSEIAQKGGLVGGVARAAALSPKKRSAIAKKAAAARWAKEGAK